MFIANIRNDNASYSYVYINDKPFNIAYFSNYANTATGMFPVKKGDKIRFYATGNAGNYHNSYFIPYK